MSDDLENEITHVILQILLEARRQGKDLLSYEEVLQLLGMDDQGLHIQYMSEYGNTMYMLNTDLLDQLEDPEILKAMIESMGETKH